jgi:NaMN:DMB phosphoribosyltransferase
VGGLEIDVIAGLIMGPASKKFLLIQIVLYQLQELHWLSRLARRQGIIFPHSIDHLSQGTKIFFELLGYPPLFDLNTRLDEGTGDRQPHLISNLDL